MVEVSSNRVAWDGVIRLIVVGNGGSGKTAVIESFSRHLRRSEPRSARQSAMEAIRPASVDGSDGGPSCTPGDVGFDALGRRVCLLEIPSALAESEDRDVLLTLAEMPFRVKRHFSRADGCVVVADAAAPDALDTVRQWRLIVGALKSECPALLLLNDFKNRSQTVESCALSDEEITRHAEDLGIIGWRMCGCAVSDADDSVLDAFGALIDYCHATAPALDDDAEGVDEEDIDPSVISCSNTNVQSCALT